MMVRQSQRSEALQTCFEVIKLYEAHVLPGLGFERVDSHRKMTQAERQQAEAFLRGRARQSLLKFISVMRQTFATGQIPQSS